MHKIAQIAVVLVAVIAGGVLGHALDQTIPNALLRWGLIVILATGIVTLAELGLKALFRSERRLPVTSREFARVSVVAILLGILLTGLVGLPLHGPRGLLLVFIPTAAILLRLTVGRAHAIPVFAALCLLAGGMGLMYVVTDALGPFVDGVPTMVFWPNSWGAGIFYGCLLAIGLLGRGHMRLAKFW